MNKLISFELKRNSLRSYHVAVLISAVSMLALLYLLAAIPKLDPTEADIDMFMSYNSLVGLTNIISMVVFTILSAVMSAKFIVEEYAGKRAILLFSYPIERQKILASKIGMVFLYTVISMILCGTVVFAVFFLTETFFPLCADVLSIKTIVYSFLSLVCYSLLAGVWGIIALWFGFGKQSITVTIVAAVIIATVACQIMAMTLNYFVGTIAFLIVGAIAAVIVLKSLIGKVNKMEV